MKDKWRVWFPLFMEWIALLNAGMGIFVLRVERNPDEAAVWMLLAIFAQWYTPR